MKEPEPPKIYFLSPDPEWKRGFESGIVYALMSVGAPVIGGVHALESQEQLFLFGHQFNYSWSWKELDDKTLWIQFSRPYEVHGRHED